MRSRGSSIRRKIAALLLVPLVSLVVVWACAALPALRGTLVLLHAGRVTDEITDPVGRTTEALCAERRAALVLLATPRPPAADASAAGVPGGVPDGLAPDGSSPAGEEAARSAAAAALRSATAATDRAVAALTAGSRDATARSALSPPARAGLAGLLDRAHGLRALRARITGGTLSRSAALTAYDDQIQPYYDLLPGLGPQRDVPLYRDASALVELARAREAVSREDALYAADQAAGSMSRADQRAFGAAVSWQRAAYQNAPDQLPSDEAGDVRGFWTGDRAARALHTDEERVLDATPASAAQAVGAGDWDRTAGSVLTGLTTLDQRLRDAQNARVREHATGVLTRTAAVVGFGLLAVLLSLAVSVRIGRGLVRGLSALRREAEFASGVRLPRVMRRLAAGDPVDVAAELPYRSRPPDEIGAVGGALDTLQRAAVEAALRQAELRRGVSEVFVNLARRSQVLLHRQLALLDAMERRAQAGEELADLFRLDHLTTRMRRHAEGLVILSGAPPARQWRKPVPLMDVVRAAVAEVEDYERVEVRRISRVAVSGSVVADLTHLLAELIENGTVFSPPNAPVQVRGEPDAGGYRLRVADRGLGMPPDLLLGANLRLAETSRFELADTGRLGLYVVSRLAWRTGVRVSLSPGRHGGITATVLLPSTLLTELEEDETDTEERPRRPDGRAAPGRGAPRPGRLPGRARAAGGDVPDSDRYGATEPGRAEPLFGERGIIPMATAPEDFVADARRGRAYPVDRHGTADEHQPAAPAPPGPRAARDRPRPTDPAPAPPRRPPAPSRRAAPDAPPATPPTPPAGGPTVHPAAADPPAARGRDAVPGRPGASGHTAQGLPRRVRQASLADRRGTAEPPADTSGQPAQPSDGARAGAPLDRDPEEARTRMASLQEGWQRARAEADTTTSGPGVTHRRIRHTAENAPDGDGTATTAEGDER